MKTPFSIPSAGFLMLSLLLAASTLKADDLQVLKLNGRWSQPPTDYFIGSADSRCALAVSDKWILAGAPSADEQAMNQGAVQVFNAVTGAWVRKLLPPAPAVAATSFGNICVIVGNQAVISTSPGVGIAQVFVYDLLTGKKLRDLTVPGLVALDFFGSSIAVGVDKVLVGAPGKDNKRGAAYLFSLRTGELIAQLQPTSTVFNDLFGAKVAIDGLLAVISAPGDNGTTGSAYLYDLQSTALIQELIPTTAVMGNDAGLQGVAITEGKVLLTCNTNGVGKLFLIDTVTGAQRVLTSSDGFPGDDLGISLAADAGLAIAGRYNEKAFVFDLRSASNNELKALTPGDSFSPVFGIGGVAIYQGTVLGTAEADNTLANGCGAVYAFRTVTRPLPMTKVAARGDFAPGAAETTYATLGDAFINSDSEVAFTSTLTGGGSNAGKDNGMWSTMAMNNTLDLVLKSRDTVLGGNVVSVSRPIINATDTALYRITRSGTGITTLNNQLLMKDDGTTTSKLSQNPFGTPDLNYPTLVQSSILDLAAFTVNLRKGINGVNTGNDSGLVLISPFNNALETEREGEQIGTTGLNYGQFTGRVAMYRDTATYVTAVQTDPAGNQALVRKVSGNPETLIASRGTTAAGAAPALFSSFIGESIDDSTEDLYRATLSAPATSANNEGLWVRTSPSVFSHTLAMRKGDPLPGLVGVKILRFLQFWQTFNQTIALVALSGTGVTAANDKALLLYQKTGANYEETVVLMREGDPAPGCHPATIGTISNVQVDTYYGQYLVLASLAGAPASANQCLFRGASRADSLSAGMQYLRRPVAILRKGELFTSRSSKLRSISLPTTNVTPGGGGCTGLGSAMKPTADFVTPDTIVLTLEFDNGARQIMKGIP